MAEILFVFCSEIGVTKYGRPLLEYDKYNSSTYKRCKLKRQVFRISQSKATFLAHSSLQTVSYQIPIKMSKMAHDARKREGYIHVHVHVHVQEATETCRSGATG